MQWNHFILSDMSFVTQNHLLNGISNKMFVLLQRINVTFPIALVFHGSCATTAVPKYQLKRIQHSTKTIV